MLVRGRDGFAVFLIPKGALSVLFVSARKCWDRIPERAPVNCGNSLNVPSNRGEGSCIASVKFRSLRARSEK